MPGSDDERPCAVIELAITVGRRGDWGGGDVYRGEPKTVDRPCADKLFIGPALLRRGVWGRSCRRGVPNTLLTICSTVLVGICSTGFGGGGGGVAYDGSPKMDDDVCAARFIGRGDCARVALPAAGRSAAVCLGGSKYADRICSRVDAGPGGGLGLGGSGSGSGHCRCGIPKLRSSSTFRFGAWPSLGRS